ncbi:MAG TPA: glycosyltransferase family protein [Thermoleophilaceae bacterium]
MRVAAFVQARMGSTRLPGKALLPVWRDMPLIELVLRRASAAASLDNVVLVTTSDERDDPLAEVGERLGVAVFRGAEHDVLGRFASALERHPADAVVRVCADNPFVDPSALDQLVGFFESVQPCDYASNHTALSGLPDGSGGEVMSATSLRRAAAEAVSPYDREHVAPFVVGRPEAFRIRFAPPPADPWPFLKLDIDTPRDYSRLRRLADRLPDDQAPLWDLPTVVECATPSS